MLLSNAFTSSDYNHCCVRWCVITWASAFRITWNRLIRVEGRLRKGVTRSINSIYAWLIEVYKAYSILGIIKRNFRQMDRITFTKLYKFMVRSHLDYAVSVWSPHYMMCIEDIEKVQRRATEMIFECEYMTYSDRLRFLILSTLAYWRVSDRRYDWSLIKCWIVNTMRKFNKNYSCLRWPSFLCVIPGHILLQVKMSVGLSTVHAKNIKYRNVVLN